MFYDDMYLESFVIQKDKTVLISKFFLIQKVITFKKLVKLK